jgi:hypothetical protein
MDKSKFGDRKELRKFAVGLGIILCAVGIVQLLKGRPAYPYFFAAGGLTALAGILIPICIKPVFILFSYLGAAMGWFSTRVILAGIFFLLLTPIALVMRLAGKKFLSMGTDRNLGTYWVHRNKTYRDPESFENQY